MVIICNGKEQEVAEGATLAQLLAQLGLDPETVVVECDRRIIHRDAYDGLHLGAGQRLELIRFVGGG
jgi:thiamine biosynthesis protein ThiS